MALGRGSMEPATFDSVAVTVLANRLETIVRDMSNTLLRAGRSAVLNVARDFSCSLVTTSDELVASAEGLPIHVFGSPLQTKAMRQLHKSIRKGDAFLHNDPYLGNTHAADHTFLVPVFVAGEHVMTACAKAHQADIGNSIPTTYHAGAKDVYEEGALVFPCVKVQEDGQDIDDIIRMCRRRIRVPDQWYGDYLAGLGAARIGERRIEQLFAEYGRDTLRTLIEKWFDYSENRLADIIRKLPHAEVSGSGRHDPFPPALPDGIPLKVQLTINPDEAMIDVDLRDNVDCCEAGLNLTEATSISAAVMGVLNSLSTDVPLNAGSMRRIKVHLREGSVVGIPRFPHSCSLATSNVADRVTNILQRLFAEVSDGLGAAEGAVGLTAGLAVISGRDERDENKPYVNQLFLENNGGPGTANEDGWLTYGRPAGGGLLYRDSVEMDEMKYPMLVKSIRLLPDTGGAGRSRGGAAAEVVFGPRGNPMTAVVACDGEETPPQGVRGGSEGVGPATWKVLADGSRETIPPVATVNLNPGEFLAGTGCGGAGYGDPLDRDPELVRYDVMEKWVSLREAAATYGVIILEDEVGSVAVDAEATRATREQLRSSRSGSTTSSGE